MAKLKKHGLWPSVVMVCVLAVLFGSLVTAEQETYQGGQSWPHGVQVDGQSAIQKLRQIHNIAIEKLHGATGADKPNIEKVLRLSFSCAAYDGREDPGTPPPAHAQPHTGAVDLIRDAFKALTDDPQNPNWAVCAEKLEHGHEE